MKKNTNKIFITTSWDDGSILDLKLLNLLNKYSIKGTFYIPQHFDNRRSKFFTYQKRLAAKDIKKISFSQEVGAHTVNHVSLTDLSFDQINHEVIGGKRFLEGIINKDVKMFCFPNGRFNQISINAVKQAGFIGARIIEKLNYKLPQDCFKMGTSIHCYPFPFRKVDAKKYYYRRLFDPGINYGMQIFKFSRAWQLCSWKSFTKSFFEYVIKNGNYFHLHGHSWELEKYDMWGDLEDFFKFLKQFNNVEYFTNSEIINFIKRR